MTDYSVIIPCFNEQQSIVELYERLASVFQKLSSSFEIIFIDDGSTDNTWNVIMELKNRDPRVKGVSFRSNFGKSIAFSCGFEHATGEVIFTIDGDLQDTPEEIPKFIAKLNEGYDLVSGWKKERKDSIDKVAASRVFNFFTSRLTGVKIHDFNCGFKVYKKKVIKNIDIYGDLFRFIPALVKWKGFKVSEVIVQHNPRKYSKSKYGASRLLRGFFDLFTILFLLRYLRKPLHFFGIVGGLVLITGFGINLYLAIIWAMGHQIGNRPLLVLGMLLMITGFQFVSTGLLGEMLVNFQSKFDKSNYPVSEKTDNL